MDLTQQQTAIGKDTSGSHRIRGQNLSGASQNQQSPSTSQSEEVNLDLFSTSQTKRDFKRNKSKDNNRRSYDICDNNAPYFGYQINGKTWGVVQGCCNDWNCPRCGQQRAREEYGRIVAGAREIGKTHKLYMFTITCRGREMSYEQAEDGYLVWTNKLLTALRTEAKRAGNFWAYASVTERQKRKHPHSHYLTTYCPSDVVPIKKGERKHYFTNNSDELARHELLQSESLEQACYRSGLGWQYDLSELQSVEGASRYVAKYLFKESIFETIWPKGWRRVRYSQNWPKLPDVKGEAMILLSAGDWNTLAQKAVVVLTKDDGAKEFASRRLSYAGVIVQ